MPVPLNHSQRLAGLCLAASVLLSGCALEPPVTVSPTLRAPAAGTALRGFVHGGQQPISGASVQLYAAGTNGTGSAATPLLNAPAITDADGAFQASGFTCPSAAVRTFLTSTGGNPGLPGGGVNAAAAMMLDLGPCGGIGTYSQVKMNEVTTVVSVYPVRAYMTSMNNLGATVSESTLLNTDFNLVSQLIDPATGKAPGQTLPSGYVMPAATINSLANSVATCINSAGGVAGDGSACGFLFQYATPPGGSPPTNTIDAVLNIAKNPYGNVAAIFNLAPGASAFSPALQQSPADWTLSITTAAAPATLPQRGSLVGEYLLTEGSGTRAHDSSGLGNDGTIKGAAWEGNQDLNFTASGQSIELPTGVNPARTWQFAFFNAPFGSQTLPQMPGYGTLYDFPHAMSILCGTDADHLCLLSTSFLGPRAMRFLSATDYTEAGVTLPNGWHVVTYICGSSAGKTHILYDGAEVSSYVQQGDANTCPNPTSGNFQIGGSSFGSGTGFVGKVAAVWAWSTALSLPEAQAAGQYGLSLMQQRGIQTQFTDVVNTNPVILGGLDSRTHGDGVTPETVWLQKMQLDSTFERRNLGFSSQTVFDACAQFDATYSEQIGNSLQPVIVMIWGGVNDGTESSQQIADGLHCMVTKAKNTGARVILATDLGAYSNEGTYGDARKNGLDAIVRPQAFSWGVDNLADLASDPRIGADGASADTNCFPDHLHPGPGCEPNITAIMQNAVNELLGSTAQTHHSSAAATYQEQAGDDFLDLAGGGAQSVTLPSCIGYSLPRQITNLGSGAAALLTSNGETLTGSASIAPNTVATIVPVPGPLTQGGCTWSRTQ